MKIEIKLPNRVSNTVEYVEGEAIREAVAESRRFIQKAERAFKSIADANTPSRDRSAMIRASLDLSACLSSLRSTRKRFYQQ